MRFAGRLLPDGPDAAVRMRKPSAHPLPALQGAV